MLFGYNVSLAGCNLVHLVIYYYFIENINHNQTFSAHLAVEINSQTCFAHSRFRSHLKLSICVSAGSSHAYPNSHRQHLYELDGLRFPRILNRAKSTIRDTIGSNMYKQTLAQVGEWFSRCRIASPRPRFPEEEDPCLASISSSWPGCLYR